MLILPVSQELISLGVIIHTRIVTDFGFHSLGGGIVVAKLLHTALTWKFGLGDVNLQGICGRQDVASRCGVNVFLLDKRMKTIYLAEILSQFVIVLFFCSCVERQTPEISFVIPPSYRKPKDITSEINKPYRITLSESDSLRLKWAYPPEQKDPPDYLEMGVFRAYLNQDQTDIVLNVDSLRTCNGSDNDSRWRFRGFLRGQVYEIAIGQEDVKQRKSGKSQMVVQKQIIVTIE